MARPVTIPGKAILSLSKSHPLYQSDKVVLSEEAAELIASTVEMRLKEIIDTSKKLMNNSIRLMNSNLLTQDDVRNALTSLNMQDMGGYSNCYDYRYVWSTKLYKGNRVIKRESCYKSNTAEKSWGRFRLSQFVKQELQKPVPSSPGVTVSWAVVEGRVPLMAKGMVEDVTKEFQKRLEDSLLKEKIKEVSFVDSTETDSKLENLSSLAKMIKTVESDLTEDFDNEYLDRALLDAINKQIVHDKHLVKNQRFLLPKIDYILTKEHRFFLKEIRNMLKRASFSQEPDIQTQYQKVTDILRNSMGLDQLLPELCFMFTTEMNRFRTNHLPFNINTLLQYVEALTSNPHLQLHHYVHQLLVPLLDLLLSEDSNTNPVHVYKSLVLRKMAAQCISNISSNLKRNNNGLETIDDYLMNLYKNEITNEDCPLSVLYGGLCGISKLPILAKRVVFYPLVPVLLNVIMKKQNKLNVYLKNKEKQKTQYFKQRLLHEIFHLLLEILYDSSLEDMATSLESSGTMMTMSSEATSMVKDLLSRGSSSSVNPELLLQMYVALLNKCHTLMVSLNTRDKNKRKHMEMVDGEDGLVVEDLENGSKEKKKKKTPQEVYNIQDYTKLFGVANNLGRVEEFKNKVMKNDNKEWYNFNSIHSLTLTL